MTGIFLLPVVLFFLFHQSVFSSSIEISPVSGNVLADKEQELTVRAKLLIKSEDGTKYFLRGVFSKEGKGDYCGYTYNGQDYFKGPYSSGEGWKNFLEIKISSASAETELKARFDPEDSGCREQGGYFFKIQRFTESGSGIFDSQNEILVNVEFSIPSPTLKPSSTPKPTLSKTSPSQQKIIPSQSLVKPSEVRYPTVVNNSPKNGNEIKITDKNPTIEESFYEESSYGAVMADFSDNQNASPSSSVGKISVPGGSKQFLPFLIFSVLAGAGAVYSSFVTVRRRRRNPFP